MINGHDAPPGFVSDLFVRCTEVAGAPILVHPQLLYARALVNYVQGNEGEVVIKIIEVHLLEFAHRLLHRVVAIDDGSDVGVEHNLVLDVGFQPDFKNVAGQPLVWVSFEAFAQIGKPQLRRSGDPA